MRLIKAKLWYKAQSYIFISSLSHNEIACSHDKTSLHIYQSQSTLPCREQSPEVWRWHRVHIYVTRGKITREIKKGKMLLDSYWESSPASPLNQGSVVHTTNSLIWLSLSYFTIPALSNQTITLKTFSALNSTLWFSSDRKSPSAPLHKS